MQIREVYIFHEVSEAAEEKRENLNMQFNEIWALHKSHRQILAANTNKTKQGMNLHMIETQMSLDMHHYNQGVP